jgi:hypothetical protein
VRTGPAVRSGVVHWSPAPDLDALSPVARVRFALGLLACWIVVAGALLLGLDMECRRLMDSDPGRAQQVCGR